MSYGSLSGSLVTTVISAVIKNDQDRPNLTCFCQIKSVSQCPWETSVSTNTNLQDPRLTRSVPHPAKPLCLIPIGRSIGSFCRVAPDVTRQGPSGDDQPQMVAAP